MGEVRLPIPTDPRIRLFLRHSTGGSLSAERRAAPGGHRRMQLLGAPRRQDPNTAPSSGRRDPFRAYHRTTRDLSGTQPGHVGRAYPDVPRPARRQLSSLGAGRPALRSVLGWCRHHVTSGMLDWRRKDAPRGSRHRSAPRTESLGQRPISVPTSRGSSRSRWSAPRLVCAGGRPGTRRMAA